MSQYAKQIEFFQSGNSAWALATVDFYAAGTTTRVNVYSDRTKQSAVANPYTLNSLGRPNTVLYADGLIKIVITPTSGAAITYDNISYALTDGPWIDASTYATLQAAITAIGSTPATLLVNSAISCTADATVPSTLALKVEHPGVITIASGKTLTINGPFDAPNGQCFNPIGDVVFGVSAVKHSNPRWFGALGDNATDDTCALQCAISSHIWAHCPPGRYKITSALTMPSGHKLTGIRSNVTGEGTWINQTASDYHITITQTYNADPELQQYSQYNEVAYITFTGSSGLGIRTAFTESLEVHHCNFSGTVNGLYMSTNANEADFKPHIYNNIFGGNVNGIWTGDTKVADAWIKDNVFTNCTAYAFRSGYLDGGIVTGNAVFNSLSSATENNGFLINKPIWTTIADNQFFEVNGWGLYISGGRWTNVYANRFVKTGKSTDRAALVTTQYGGVTNCTNLVIRDNIFADVYGGAMSLGNIYDSQIANNNITGAGYDSTNTHDAITIATASNILVLGNKVDGNSYTDDTQRTRYWMSLNTATDITSTCNTQENCVNGYTVATTASTLRLKPGTNTRTVTTTATQFHNDDIILCNATGGAFSVNLQPAGTYINKRLTLVKIDSSANAVDVDPNSSETINGAATYSLTAQYKRVVIVSDGTKWIIESSN